MPRKSLNSDVGKYVASCSINIVPVSQDYRERMLAFYIHCVSYGGLPVRNCANVRRYLDRVVAPITSPSTAPTCQEMGLRHKHSSHSQEGSIVQAKNFLAMHHKDHKVFVGVVHMFGTSIKIWTLRVYRDMSLHSPRATNQSNRADLPYSGGS